MGPASLQPGEDLKTYGRRFKEGLPPTPAPWDCDCGPATNAAAVTVCPTCGKVRPYAYEPPPLTTGDAPQVRHEAGELPEHYPQPGETPDQYAERMQAVAATETNGVTAIAIGDGVIEMAPLALLAPKGGPGHYAPITLRSGRTTLQVDPVVLQLVMETANKAAVHGAVRSIDVAVTSATAVKLTLVVDIDRTGDPLPHQVQDE